jgi:hypothetical protein
MDLHFNENITGWLEFIGPTKEDYLPIGKFVWEKDRPFNETDHYTLSTDIKNTNVGTICLNDNVHFNFLFPVDKPIDPVRTDTK